MSCDVVTRRKGWRMSCDVGEVTEGFENEQMVVAGAEGSEAAAATEEEEIAAVAAVIEAAASSSSISSNSCFSTVTVVCIYI